MPKHYADPSLRLKDICEKQNVIGSDMDSRVQAVEMSYLRSACGVSRMDGMSNESVYKYFGMCHVGEGKKCGVVEEVKQQTLKWFDHLERMEESKMTRRVYVSEIEGGNFRG